MAFGVRKSELIYSVKDFGALGDNSTDDTAAIQKTISMTRLTGGIVSFPTGTFMVSAPIVVPQSGLTVQGAGRSAWLSNITAFAGTPADTGTIIRATSNFAANQAVFQVAGVSSAVCVATNTTITVGTTAANSGPFVNTDATLAITIVGAGVSGANLVTTIASFTSATQVVLTVAPSTSGNFEFKIARAAGDFFGGKEAQIEKVTIKDLTIDGNGKTTPAGIRVWNFVDCNIRNTLIKNITGTAIKVGNDISLDSCTHLLVDTLQVDGCATGIDTGATVTAPSITCNFLDLRNFTTNGILGLLASSTIKDSYFNGPAATGYALELTDASTNVSCVGLTMENCAGGDMHLANGTSTKSVTFLNCSTNWLLTTTGRTRSIYIQNGDALSFTNCKVVANSHDSGTFKGFESTANATAVTEIGWHIEGFTGSQVPFTRAAGPGVTTGNINNIVSSGPIASSIYIETGVRTSATSTTMAANEQVLIITATGQTVTLPAVAVGRKATIKFTAVGTCTLSPASGTIDSAATYVISNQNQSTSLISDGTNWFITSLSVPQNKTIKSITGSASATFTGIAAVATKRLKVFSIVLMTASTAAVTLTFKDGASGTALMAFPMQAISGTEFGVALGVMPDSFLFATTAGNLLELSFSSANSVTYNISYWDDDTA